MFRIKQCLRVIVAGFVLASGGTVQAEDYPIRPVRLIVPFPAGSGTDITSRVLAKSLGTALGTTVIVENKPGAGGMVGAVAAAHYRADGYTIFLGNVATLIGKVIQPSAAFDPLKDFTPISMAYTSPAILTVDANSPVKTAADLVRWAKAHPGVLNYYSGGVGTAAHLLGATFSTQEKLDTIHVPVRTAADMMPQLTDGTPHFAFFVASAVRPHLDSKRLRAIAVSSRGRVPQLPDVPSLYEVFKDDSLVQESWLGIWAPAHTPAPVVQKLFDATVRAVKSPEFATAMLRLDQQATASASPQAYGEYVRGAYENIGRLAKHARISPD